MGGPIGVGLFHDGQEVPGTFGAVLGESRDLNVAVFVLHNVQHIFVV